MDESSSAYLIDYAMYVTFGMVFAFISAFIVVQFAPYAAGAGLTEVIILKSSMKFLIDFCFYSLPNLEP